MISRISILAVLALALLGWATPVRAAVSEVSPDIGPPGTTFNFRAEGFEPYEIVKVAFRTRSGTVRFTDSSGMDVPVYADNIGRALWVYTTPDDAPTGPVIAEATGTKSRVVRDLAFVVQAGAAPVDVAPPRPGGEVAVSPQVGPPGTLFAFRSAGFSNYEQIAVWVHSPTGDLSTLAIDIGGKPQYYADGEGVAKWLVTTRADTPDGEYTAVAIGVSSGEARVATFVVRQGAAAAPPLPTGNATVSPAVGPPGTSFSFTATGFSRNEKLGIWIHKPDGQIADVSPDGDGVSADKDGVAVWSVTTSTSLANGVYTMVAEGRSSAVVRIVRFEVRR
jgi:hypothetical protein